MASEIRVDKINSLSGVGTVTLSPTGVDIAGITTAATLRATTGIVTSLTAGSLTSLGAVSGTTGTFTGDVDIADTIVHTGDTNTKIRFPAADTITAETGGSERARIDSSGNTNFGAEKSVALPSGTGIQVYHSANPRIKLVNDTTSNGATDGTQIYLSSDGDTIIDNKDSEDIIFHCNASEKVRLTSSGNFGIGTDSPDRKLDVSGTGNVYGKFQSTNTTGAGIEVKDSSQNWLIQADGAGANSSLAFYDKTNTTYRVHMKDNGNLEIVDGDLVIKTSGHGIDFSATGDASGSSSELFDDYEEGTFTPRLGGSNNSGTYYVNGTGTYIKIGRTVSVSIRFNAVNLDDNASGNAMILNLPFNAGHAPTNGVAGVTQNVQYYNVPFSTTYISNWYISSGANAWNGLVSRSNTTWDNFPVSDFHAATLYLNFFGTYFTA